MPEQLTEQLAALYALVLSIPLMILGAVLWLTGSRLLRRFRSRR